jgi:hypothetical protein
LRGEGDESANLIEVANSPPAYSLAREVLNAGRPGASSNSLPRPAPNRPAPQRRRRRLSPGRRSEADGTPSSQRGSQAHQGAAAVRSPLHPPQGVQPRHPVAEHHQRLTIASDFTPRRNQAPRWPELDFLTMYPNIPTFVIFSLAISRLYALSLSTFTKTNPRVMIA